MELLWSRNALDRPISNYQLNFILYTVISDGEVMFMKTFLEPSYNIPNIQNARNIYEFKDGSIIQFNEVALMIIEFLTFQIKII